MQRGQLIGQIKSPYQDLLEDCLTHCGTGALSLEAMAKELNGPGVLGVPHALQILDSNLPPDSIHFGYGDWGAFGYLYWGISHGNRTSAA